MARLVKARVLGAFAQGGKRKGRIVFNVPAGSIRADPGDVIHPTGESFKGERRVVDLCVGRGVRHNGEEEPVDLYLVHAADHTMPPLSEDLEVMLAVSELQRALRLNTADGIVGPDTLAAIQEMHDQARGA